MHIQKRIYFFSWLVSLLVNRFKNPLKHDYKRILIIRLDEIGDMMTSLPVFEALHDFAPQAQLTVWCTPLASQLLKHHPHIQKIIHDQSELKERYDLIVDLRGNGITNKYAILHQPYYRLDRGTIRFYNKFKLPQHPHEIKANLQVLQPLIGKLTAEVKNKIYFGEENVRAAAKFLSDHEIKKIALFHPFSMKKLKEWNPEKFALLATKLKEDFGFECVFIGTKKEEQHIAVIQQQIPFKTYVFAGYNLLDLAALCANASLMVGNDSGPMHIAATVGIPVIGLFGPGEPHLFSPYGKRTAYIHHKLECNPCDQLHCVHPDNPCMNRITVEEVLLKTKSLLTNKES